jgi:hypothetical protein
MGSIVTAVNSLGEDFASSTGLVDYLRVVLETRQFWTLSGGMPGTKKPPDGMSEGFSGSNERGLLQRSADVLEQLADDRAQEQQGDDHDDRDEGEKKTVLNEGLAFLILTPEAGAELIDISANELEHVLRYLLSSRICSAA